MTDASGAQPEQGAQNPSAGGYASMRPGVAPSAAESVASVSPATQPAVAPVQPGVAPAAPGEAATLPGIAATQPGIGAVQPGVAPGQPGAAPVQPGVAPAEQQSMTFPGASVPTFPGAPTAAQLPFGARPAYAASPTAAGAEFRSLFSPAGFGTLALTSAALIGVSLVMTIICMIVLATTPGNGIMPQVGAGAFFTLLAGVVSGGFSATVYGGVGEWGMSLGGTLNIMSIATLVTIGVVVALLTRRAARREVVPGRTWWSVLLRSATEAIAPALLMLLLAAIARMSNSANVSIMEGGLQIQAYIFGAFIWTFLVLTTAAFWGRISTRPASPTRPVAISPFVREIATYLIGTHALLLIPAFVLFIVFASQTSHPTLWMLTVPLGLNVAGLLFGSVQFSAVQMADSSSYSARTVYLWDMIGGWAALVIVLFFIALFVLSVFIGVRRQRTATFVAARVWQLPLGVVACTLFAALFLLPVSTDLSDFRQGTMWMGPSWEFSLLVLAFATIVSLLAEVTPRAVYSLNPSLLALLAGSKATARWTQAIVLPTTTPARPFNGSGAALLAPAAAAAPLGMNPAVASNPAAVSNQAVASNQTVASNPLVASNPALGSNPLAVSNPALASNPVAVPDPLAVSNPAVPTAPAAADAFLTAPVFGETAPTVPLPNFAAFPGEVAQLPPAQPMNPKAKRAIIGTLIGAGMVGLLVAGAFVTIAILNGQRDPGNEVRAYLEAIAAGDAEKASTLLDPGMRNDQRALLTKAAFAGESTTIEVQSIETEDLTDGSVSVRANYSLDGETFTHNFMVHPGPKDFLFLNTWKLSGDPLLQTVYISAPVELGTVTIGDVAIELQSDGDGQSYNTLYAYPGIYQVSYEDPSEYYSAHGDEQLRVVEYGEAQVRASVEETDALHDEVLRLVNEQVQACVEIPTNMEEYCPYAVKRTDLASMSIDAVPSGFTEIDSGYFRTEQVTFTTKRNPTTWNKNPSADTNKYTFSGRYEVVDGVVVVTDVSSSWW